MEKVIKRAVEEGSKKNPNKHEKYRWFYTSSKKLVIGGKNALQNEELIKELLKSGKEYVVMHTKTPGSPFSIIESDSIDEKDLEEAAIFTACFSRAWKERKTKTQVDIFKTSQIVKKKGMKLGTFGVLGRINSKTSELKLYLSKQKNKLRAIPYKTKNALCILPGNINKVEIAEQIAEKLKVSFEEALQALPTGESKICSQ